MGGHGLHGGRGGNNDFLGGGNANDFLGTLGPSVGNVGVGGPGGNGLIPDFTMSGMSGGRHGRPEYDVKFPGVPAKGHRDYRPGHFHMPGEGHKHGGHRGHHHHHQQQEPSMGGSLEEKIMNMLRM